MSNKSQRLFVVMDDDTQTVCPVEASTQDEARILIAERLGRDVSDQPIYDADNPDDMDMILSILKRVL